MLYLLVLPSTAFRRSFVVSDNRTLVPASPNGRGAAFTVISFFVSVTTGRPKGPLGEKNPVFSSVFSFRLFDKVVAATCSLPQNGPIFRVDSMFVYRTKQMLLRSTRSMKPRNFRGFLFSPLGQMIFDSRFSIADRGDLNAL